MPKHGEMTDAERQQRSDAGTSHGAYSYAKRLGSGQLITSGMAAVESEVVRLFNDGGEKAMIEGAAIRLETMARLIHQHIERAEPEEAVRLALLWRVFQRDAVKTWAIHAALPNPDDGADGAAIVAKYRTADDTTNSNSGNGSNGGDDA
jgi:hypothetical protein